MRGRAALWASITAIVIVMPWSRHDCAVGSVSTALAATAAAVLCAAAGVAALQRMYGWRRRDPLAELPGYVVLLAIVACGEEVLFRGVVLRATAPSIGFGAAIALSAVVFGLAHWSRPRPKDAVFHVFTGAILGVVASQAAGWGASAAVHIVYNCVAFEWWPAAAPGRQELPAVMHAQ